MNDLLFNYPCLYISRDLSYHCYLCGGAPDVSATYSSCKIKLVNAPKGIARVGFTPTDYHSSSRILCSTITAITQMMLAVHKQFLQLIIILLLKYMRERAIIT